MEREACRTAGALRELLLKLRALPRRTTDYAFAPQRQLYSRVKPIDESPALDAMNEVFGARADIEDPLTCVPNGKARAQCAAGDGRAVTSITDGVAPAIFTLHEMNRPSVKARNRR